MHVHLVYDPKEGLGNYLAGALYFLHRCPPSLTWSLDFLSTPLLTEDPEVNQYVNSIHCSEATRGKIDAFIQDISNQTQNETLLIQSTYWYNLPPNTLITFPRPEPIHEACIFFPYQIETFPQFEEKYKEWRTTLSHPQPMVIHETMTCKDLDAFVLLQSCKRIYQLCTNNPHSAALSEVVAHIHSIPCTRWNLDIPPPNANTQTACVVFSMTAYHGFYAFLFFLLQSYCYAKFRGLPFYICNSGWQYTHKDGWHDYFTTLSTLPTSHSMILYSSDESYVPTMEETDGALREVYVLQPDIRKDIKKQYDVAIYVRRGDKYVESTFVSEESILEQVSESILPSSTLFIQSDDYTVIERFRALLPTHTIDTLTLPTERGSYHNSQYIQCDRLNPNKVGVKSNLEKDKDEMHEEMIRFLRAMHYCTSAQVCWTDSQSNVGQFHKRMNPGTRYYR